MITQFQACIKYPLIIEISFHTIQVEGGVKLEPLYVKDIRILLQGELNKWFRELVCERCHLL